VLELRYEGCARRSVFVTERLNSILRGETEFDLFRAVQPAHRLAKVAAGRELTGTDAADCGAEPAVAAENLVRSRSCRSSARIAA
jgi:hypothetical protein